MEAGIGVFVLCCMSLLSPFYGVSEGELHGCPPSPNCISSQSMKFNLIHHTEALQYSVSREEAFRKVKGFIDASENVHIDEIREGEYIRLTYFTKVFRFPDRVELFFPNSEQIVQFRSHSWLGFWDVFANRIRREKFQRVLTAEDPPKKDEVFL
ncbi:hypothetical protein LPTSP4_18910 [Leptospira ryugenii]|uniref:DUF1499 domain-containing protein n=1 Tax=Leptospira ryugenii TaxID=1917863 RepID=A0A2P2E0P7_9LEPT|nr:DUF1499 domain-containing protein [Leptospira ryugenii]GBF50366.1 hypothetical protein LPTSP4_18910 [Leptospira ryugenii]